MYDHRFLKIKRHFFYIKQKFLLHQTCLQDANLEISLENIFVFSSVNLNSVFWSFNHPNSSQDYSLHHQYPTHQSLSFSFFSSFYISFSIKSSLCCLAILGCGAFSGEESTYKGSWHDMMPYHVKAGSPSPIKCQ